MLNSLYIKNFRLFKEFTIEKFSRINLIVGRNNSGKTCLLEALQVYAKNASPRMLYELIIERGEDWEILKNDDISLEDIENPLRHLFYGYHFPEKGEDCAIEIGSITHPEDRLKLHLHLYQRIEIKETQRFLRVDDTQETMFTSENTELVLEIESNQKIIYRVSLLDFKKRYRSSIEAKLNVQIVPTNHINDDQVSTLWDNINVQPVLRTKVFEGLQLIDPDIQEIVLVGRGKNTIPILIYKEGNKRTPLQSLGDGMTHLFHIILALVNAKDGLLLIDEFENGLHYTVHPKIWDLIFKLATELNVQVFVTTHSWDCVTSFIETIQANNTEGGLFKLGRSALKSNKNQIIATAYDRDELSFITQAKFEVR